MQANPIQNLSLNAPVPIERGMGFSTRLGVHNHRDSIASAPEEGGLCARIFSCISNFFRRIFTCCFDQTETITSETESIQTTTIETESIEGGERERSIMRRFLADIDNLPRMEQVLLSMLRRGGDPKAEEHLLILTKTLRKMIDQADPNTNISFLLQCTRNNDNLSTKIILSQQGIFLLDHWTLEEYMEIQSFWRVEYKRAESSGILVNQIILNA